MNFVNNSTNTLFDTPQSAEEFTDRKYVQDGTYSIKTYRIDYSKEFSENLKLSTGSRFADVSTNNDLESYIENSNGNFNFIDEESSQFIIDETIFAIYTKLNASFGKWSFSGGLRYEDSNTDGSSTYMKDGEMVTEVQNRPIEKIFPSASLSRKFNDILGASVSYSYSCLLYTSPSPRDRG